MSAWYCKSLEHNLLKNASLPNLTNKSYSGPTSRLGYFLPSSCCLEDLVWKGGTRSDVWSDLKSCLGQCQGKAVFWAVSQWFMIYLSAPYCFPPVPVESFPVAAQGEGGCRAVADSWAVFFPPALENLANSRAVQWLPSSPELRLWAGAEFSTSCARCLIFLLWTQQLPLYKHWVKTRLALNGGGLLVWSSPWIILGTCFCWEVPARQPRTPHIPSCIQDSVGTHYTTAGGMWSVAAASYQALCVWNLSPRGCSCPLC